MADSLFPPVVAGVSTGADVRVSLNSLGSDAEISFKEVSAIAQASTELSFYETNTIVFARAEQKFYKYSGTAWQVYTYIAVAGDLVNFLLKDGSRKASFLNFDTAAGAPTYAEGNVYWDSTDHTLALQTERNTTTIQLGQEQVIRCVNKTLVEITDGTVVYISGAQGNRPTISPAIATADSTAMIIGVATEHIAVNAEGYVTVNGLVRGINTSDFEAGDPLYLSKDDAGALVNVPAPAPYHSNLVGFALNSTNSGSILVSINLGCDLATLHDVNLIDVLEGQILTMGPDGVWVNSNSIGTEAGFVRFDSTDGTLTLHNGATVFEDLVMPLTQGRVGVNLKPDFDYTGIGYLFPQNDPTEILYFVVQLPHSWLEGSTIYPHIHWRQDANQVPVFRMEYKWYNVGQAIPGSFSTYDMSTLAIPYVSGSIHQLSYGAGIVGTGKTISSLLAVKLYRTDNVYTGDCLTYQFDIHYEKDSLGSKTELTK